MFLIRPFMLFLALGLIVVPISELMFWPVVATSIPGLVFFYGLAALLAASLWERSGTKGWPAFVIAGGIFGWLIEGVIVSQTYEAVPFSLIWTPLAWHMTLSVMVGVVGIATALRHSFATVALICAALGAFVGLWGAYGWTELVRDGAVPGSALPFPAQIAIGTAMMAAGHGCLCVLPEGKTPLGVLMVLLAAAALGWAITWAGPLFPTSLTVPVLIAVSALALRCVATVPQACSARRVPLRRFAAFALIPAVAIPVHAVILEVTWLTEVNAFVALPLVVLGGGTWTTAMVVSIWRGQSASSGFFRKP